MLQPGAIAPDFTLPNQDGVPVSLRDFRGKQVVLYFYPKDNTPGCTRQACAFAGAYGEFAALDAVVIEAYGVWQEKKLYGKVSMGVVRTTFLIDREGRIQKVMPKVEPDTNAAEVLACLRGE